MLPGPSIFASFSVALALSGAKFRPAEWKASIKRPRLPPDSDTAARRLLFGGAARKKHSVGPVNSSRPRARDPPSRLEIALKVSIEPPRAPAMPVPAEPDPPAAPRLRSHLR